MTEIGGVDSTESFTYDTLGRLRSAFTDGGDPQAYEYEYVYDTLSNLIAVQSESSTPVNYDMGAPGGYQPHAVKAREMGGRGPTYEFTYDALGQMTDRESEAGDFEQAFDALGRLTSVVRDGEAATYFAYDPDGNRVLEIRPDGRTTFYPFPDYELEATSWPRTQIVLQPVEVAPSETFTVTWAAYGTLLSDCSFTGDWPATPTTTSGEQQAEETEAGSYDYALSCSNEYGTSVVTRTLTVSNNPAAGDPPPAAPIQMTASLERTTYGLGGSTVALHREGQLTPGGPYIDELYYMHGNHLGSMTLLTDEAGAVVDQARYYPFGGYRLPPTAGITDIGFTGHRQDNLGWENTGLIYMGARYYDPLLRRFISPDTIVQDAGNTMAYNRYAYVYNNPVNMVDPTGRIACDDPNLPTDDQEGCAGPPGSAPSSPPTSGGGTPGTPPIPQPVPPTDVAGSGLPQVTFADLVHIVGFDFSDDYQLRMTTAIWQAVRLAGSRLAELLNAKFPGLNISAAQVFSLAFGSSLTFKWTAMPNTTFAADTSKIGVIEIFDTRGTALGGVTNMLHFILHELGHKFIAGVGNNPYRDTSAFLVNFRIDRETNGFAGLFETPLTWQQSRVNAPGEMFADMFLGWALDTWKNDGFGRAMSQFMNNSIPGWVIHDAAQ